MSGQTQRSGESLIFTGEGIHTEASGELDEVARSWPQLMSLMTQLVRHLHTVTSDESMKLPRRQIEEMRRHGVEVSEFERAQGPQSVTESTPQVGGDIQEETMAMNRVRLTPLDDSVPDREIYVGWDRPMGTYFAQVFDGVDAAGEDVVTLDLGNEVGEIPTPDAAIDAVRPYARVEDDLRPTLVAQQEAPGAQTLSPFAEQFTAAAVFERQDITDAPVWDGFDGFDR
jgi:hypothetical protein